MEPDLMDELSRKLNH